MYDQKTHEQLKDILITSYVELTKHRTTILRLVNNAETHECVDQILKDNTTVTCDDCNEELDIFDITTD